MGLEEIVQVLVKYKLVQMVYGVHVLMILNVHNVTLVKFLLNDNDAVQGMTL
jgi:hypothetical protein